VVTEREDVLGILACDLGKRPRGAPGFPDLTPSLRGLRREDGALVAEYDDAAADTLAEVAAAERLCCAGIDWQVDGARLTVRATPEQLTALEEILAN
jgi:hypothetical protein